MKISSWGPKKIIGRKPHYSIPAVSFCRISREIDNTLYCGFHDGWNYEDFEWITCREQFHDTHPGLPNILFSHKPNLGRNVARFIREFEKRLHLEVFTSAGPTNLKNVTWFYPSPFWKGNALRKSLFTVLLRCGVHYFSEKKDAFQNALNSTSYGRDTKEAIDYFLKGMTCLKSKRISEDHNCGYDRDEYWGACWVDTFSYADDGYPQKVLRKPSVPQKKAAKKSLRRRKEKKFGR